MPKSPEDYKNLRAGKIIAGRWRILDKLGEGGMGAVYRVEDKNRKNFQAALKVEDDLYEGGVLKLEVFILTQLQKMKDTVRLYDSGKRNKYNFMVMSLCGKDLMTLKHEAGKPFSEGTTLRLAISTLYAIKQVHEIGYVHRDVKPGNCMIGKYGRDTRMIYLVDFGMARSFVAKDESGKLAIRKPREGSQLFRGTPRYCSLNTHYRKEQGRVDDLWAWLHMLIELQIGLPWNRISDEKKIQEMKEKTTPQQLIRSCPEEFYKIREYLETLKYEDRPDYHGLFSECMAGLKRVHTSFLDRYEWERDREEVNTALSISESALSKKPLTRAKLAHKTYRFASTAVFKENILSL
uniref:non-specific serine/threonine protein kinase n=1 Tax=Haemonchus contortus TaxID=6289 RepID=A0A7I4YP12_HAECO